MANREIAEGEFFIRRRLGTQTFPWGVYQRLGGQDIRITAFKKEEQARYYAAAQTISIDKASAQ